MAPSPECMDAEACEMPSLRRERVLDDCDEWTFVRARGEHDIFLSHSGSQKDFVRQLCKNLVVEAQLSPFFDQLRHCLHKGEEYAERIFKAARECEVAVVVISDEYFSRSKWPMLELEQLMQEEDRKPSRKILPLFLKLSCTECKDQERQERWFRQWAEWAKSDNRIDVGRWKDALSKLLKVNGMKFVKEVGEVAYRGEVVETVRELMQRQERQNMIVDFKGYTSEGNQNPIQDGRRIQHWTSKLCEWTMFTCFPFWCVALIKLFMVKVIIIIIVAYIVLYTIIAPIVKDTIECLMGP